MSTLDVILLAAVGLFMVRGLWRGFIRETVGIAALLAGGFAAAAYAAPAGEMLIAREVIRPDVAPFAAGSVIFIATYVAVSLVGQLLDRVARTLFLGPLVRVAGMIFAALKASVLLGLALLAGQRFTPWLITPAQLAGSRVAGPLMALATTALDAGDAWIGRAEGAIDGVAS